MRTEQVLQKALERLAVESGALGVTAAVRCDGLGAWVGAAGSRDLGKNVPMPPDACMPAYSVTKTVTAICVVRLSEIGALALDDPISKWVPDLPFGEIVSLRQLLRHSSGVPNYSVIPEQVTALAESPGRAWSFDQFVRASCHRALDFEPGAGWSYSNTGYMLLARVIERASGTPFAAAVAQHVGGPLGFSNTFALDDSLASVAPGFSRQFSSGASPEDVRGVYDPRWCATGLIASNAAELCEMIHSLFGGKLVLRESLAQMTELCPVPGEHPPAVSPSYGLGLMADPDGAYGPEFGHGGDGPGYNLRIAYYPTMNGRRVSVCAICNTETAGAASIVRGLSAELDQQLGETITLK